MTNHFFLNFHCIINSLVIPSISYKLLFFFHIKKKYIKLKSQGIKQKRKYINNTKKKKICIKRGNKIYKKKI